MKMVKSFFAYPAKNEEIAQTVRAAIDRHNAANTGVFLEGWEADETSGVPVVTPIFENISESLYVAADITFLNENVAFEIGLAIGKGKRCFLFRNDAFDGDDEMIAAMGVFDTLKYTTYGNSEELANKILSQKEFSPIRTSNKLNRQVPIYLVETPSRTDGFRTLVSSVKKSRLRYRSFNPSEEPRLATMEAISHVSQSAGVVVPLMSDGMRRQKEHNLRAMFVAGLGFGFGKPTLIIHAVQYIPPMDVRDDTEAFVRADDIPEIFQKFTPQVVEYMQGDVGVIADFGNTLNDLKIGDPIAENEMMTLSNYYLATDNYRRATRGEVNLVVGRKGAGKTALFVQLRDTKRSERRNVVIDLKPEGYQLIKLKETVLDYLSEGAKQHLITAFWEYLLLLEITYKVLEKDQILHTRDHRLTPIYNELSAIYGMSTLAREGDFSERLENLSNDLTNNFKTLRSKTEKISVTNEQLTEILYKHSIKKLLDTLCSYLKFKDEVWLLFDNIDKGWNTRGVSETDTVVLRCLIDASRKIERELQKRGIDFWSIIFVRGDIYDLLMKDSPDYGKEMRATLDWSDKNLLAEVLKKRIAYSMRINKDSDFDRVWKQISAPQCHNESSINYMLDRSLMRPRNVLKIFRHSLSHAVNLAHDKIEVEDIEEGLKTYSQDLITEIDRELTDVYPKARKLIHNFFEEDGIFEYSELLLFMELNDLTLEEGEEVIFFLLYYGVLGIQKEGEKPLYIYDVEYDIDLLKASLKKWGGAIKYILNPALWPALRVKN